MMKQSKHWLTGLLMTVMMLSLTGCASLSAPTSTQESTSHSVAVSSKTKAAKKHSTSVKDQSTSASSEAAQSSSTTAESASADQLTGALASLTGALASSAQAASTQSQTAASNAISASETTSSPASNKASAATSSTVNDQVVDGLNQAANLQPENGDQYMISQTSDGNWQVDIRTSSGEGQDPNVSHLKEIYKYNPITGQYQQMDPMTGEFN